ncbi:GyrI-like domain-containing protein [uncultured Microscilla sp.]|uniref:AraC family transcriptional regulator n=1 Tax=uncultured Microscilla sp. TaxID=432653 RepID=UPI00262B4183|nr:AraC family transcriptional regulator [uncultured Microscilla sp.]
MKNDLHIERLRSLLNLLENNFTKPLSSSEVAAATFYSYRNINRIFRAVFHKSIGRYIKELLLQEAARQLAYSDKAITDIAFELNYSDLQAFNKAFRREFACSPSQFRQQDEKNMKAWINAKLPEEIKELDRLTYSIESLPPTRILYLTHYGNYNSQGINDCWEALLEYAHQQKLLKDETRYLGELMDDDEIVKDENCRYNAAITLPQEAVFEPTGFFNTKTIASGQYVCITHQGDRNKLDTVYEQIFLHWIVKNEFEIADKPFLEFYLNDEADTSTNDLLTEIYVPVASSKL